MNEVRILLSEFTELVNQRKTNKEIAEHYGISAQKVAQLKKEAGLRTPKRKKVTLVDDISNEDTKIDTYLGLGAYPATTDNYDDSITTTDNYDDSITPTARMNDIEFN